MTTPENRIDNYKKHFMNAILLSMAVLVLGMAIEVLSHKKQLQDLNQGISDIIAAQDEMNTHIDILIARALDQNHRSEVISSDITDMNNFYIDLVNERVDELRAELHKVKYALYPELLDK